MNILNAESFDDDNILGTPSDYEQTVIEMGTVGWEGEAGSHFDLGTEQNGGVTLVKVQLFRGRDKDAARKPARAQGHKILVRLGGPWMNIPSEGSPCFVAFPAGFQEGAGIGVLFAAPGNPRDSMSRAYIRNDDHGNVTLGTETDAGLAIYFQVNPKGFIFVSPWIKVRFDETGFHILHASGARLDGGAIQGMPPPLDTLGSYVTMSAAMAHVESAVLGLGPVGGVAEPVAKALSTLTALSALAAAVTSLTTTVGALAANSSLAFSTPTANPLVGLPLVPATPLFNLIQASVAASTAVATAATTIPSSSTQVP